MQLTINISNEQLFERIVWFLNGFKNQGVEIVESSVNDLSKQDILKNLEQSVNEMNRIKEGRLEVVDARSLLNLCWEYSPSPWGETLCS